MAVPDGCHPDPMYIEWVKPGGVGSGADTHRVLYTYQILKEVFESARFSIDLLEYFDEAGQFHGKEWDAGLGVIHRSRKFDQRKREIKLDYTSIVLDAKKPQGCMP